MAVPSKSKLNADDFIAEWEEKAAGKRPTGKGHNCCLLCGTDVFPHEHSEGQIEQRRQQIQAHIDAGIEVS